MAGERFLQDFYTERVDVQGREENFRAWRNETVVKDTVKKLDEWLYQSDGSLFPRPAERKGSRKDDLHIQNDTSGSDFDFFIPLLFNPTLQLMGRLNVRDPSALETRLPDYRDPSEKLPVFSWGSKLVRNRDTLRHDELHPPTGNSSAGETDQFAESIDNRYLDPVRILQDLHKYVENALTADENSHPRDNDPVWQGRLRKPRVPQIHKSVKERITLKKLKSNCPAVQLIFRLGKDEKVSVDLVPALQDKVVLSEEWLRDDLARLSDWWDEPHNSQERFLRKTRTVGRVGADVVAKDGFWRFSFANAETDFLREIDSDGGQRRKALKLLKFINKECWVPEYGKILTSYHLKTVLLWAQDIHPEKEKWETLESSLKTLLSLLRHCVNKGKLPHYFLRDFNLFNKRYREGKGFYQHLALQVLTKEVELMNLDLVQYISLRFSENVSESSGAFSRAAASLQEFKASRWEALKKLKELEEEELYEQEEQQPDRSEADLVRCNLETVFAQKTQDEGQSTRCPGKAEEPVRTPSEQVTFSPDLDQELDNLLRLLEIQAPRDGTVKVTEQFATVDVTSEDYPGFKNYMPEVVHLSLAQRREDLTLDPDTAHPLLEISEDGKKVHCGSFMKNVRSSPRRFDTANCVVAKQSFSAGQHYWEVFVGWKPRWNLGVVSALAGRRGRLIQKKSWWWPWSEEVCTEGYWLIGYNQEKLVKQEKQYWAFDTNPMPFECSPHPETIGIYLDYPGGKVTFYNADDSSNLIPLYSFYNAAFKKDPVYPVFDPCWHDNGGNIEPLKIL